MKIIKPSVNIETTHQETELSKGLGTSVSRRSFLRATASAGVLVAVGASLYTNEARPSPGLGNNLTGILNGSLLADTYIDPTQLNDGDGTMTAPYNSFKQVNELVGDQGSKRILLKCGTVIRDMIEIVGASNFIITQYGSGDNPIINAADIVSLDSLTVAGTNLYSFPTGDWIFQQQSGTLGVADWQKAVYVNGMKMWLSNSLDGIVANQQILSGGNVYFKTSGSLSGADVIEVSCRRQCIYLGACANFEISGVEVKYGMDSNISCDATQTGGYARILFNKSTFSGNYTGGGRDGIVVYGVGSAGGYTSGVVIYGNECNWNHNNGVEVWGLAGASVVRNSGVSNGQGIELWGQTINSVIMGNNFCDNLGIGASSGANGYGLYGRPSVSSQGCGIWLTYYNTGGDPGTGGNNGNTIAYNVFAGFSGQGIKIKAGAGNYVYNNTVVSMPISNDVDYITWKTTVKVDRTPILVDKDVADASCTLRNNLFVSLYDFTAWGGKGPQLAQYGQNGTIDGSTFIVNADYNTYWAPYKPADAWPVNTLIMVVNNAGNGKFTSYQSACSVMTTGQEANSYLEDPGISLIPPLGVNAIMAKINLALSDFSAAQYNGAHPGAVVSMPSTFLHDILGASPHAPPSRGAYQ